jgi:hypothetical protein
VWFFFYTALDYFTSTLQEPKKGNLAIENKGNNGAGDGFRTRDPKLGKLVLYQLSYARFFEKHYIGRSVPCQLKNRKR